MRQKGIRGLLLIAIYEASFGNAVVARLVVLEAIGIKIVRQRDEKVVVIVMASAEKRSRLPHQTAIGGNLFIRYGQSCDAIGRDIQVVGRLNVRRKRNGPEVLSGKDR